MEKKKKKKIIKQVGIVVLVIGLIVLQGFISRTTLGIVVLVIGSIVLQGLKKIPADPPSVGLETLFGHPIPRFRQSGWQFFFGYPFIQGFILIDVTKKNSTSEDILPQSLRTTDNAESIVPLEVTWVPVETGEALIKYNLSGKESGIWKILAGIIEQRLREWARSPLEGPQSGEALLGVGDEAVNVLLKAISGKSLEPMPDYCKIPTPILLHYSNEPRPPVRPEEKNIAGENWEKVEKSLNKLKEKEQKEIKDAIEKRKKNIQGLKNGAGEQEIKHLGIKLVRFNIGNIKPIGKYAESLELEAKEKQEKKAEIYEIRTDIAKAQEIVDALSKTKQEITLEEAFRIVMEWKATREGRGFTIPGLAESLTKIIRAILAGKEG